MKPKREELIHSITKIQDSSEGTPRLSDIADFMVVMKMNQECRECNRSVYNFGQCTGRTSTTPCLIFQQRSAIPHAQGKAG